MRLKSACTKAWSSACCSAPPLGARTFAVQKSSVRCIGSDAKAGSCRQRVAPTLPPIAWNCASTKPPTPCAVPSNALQFEHVRYSSTTLRHEISMGVDAHPNVLLEWWAEKRHVSEWFKVITKIEPDSTDPSAVRVYLSYQWGAAPAIELYTALRAEHDGGNIAWLPVEGSPLSGGVLFLSANEASARTTWAPAPSDSSQCTVVTLRIAYALPSQLRNLAGELAVYADVDQLLCEGMARMKARIESMPTERRWPSMAH